MKDNLPPEERLLRLIRGQKKSRIPALAEGNLNAFVPAKIPQGSIGQKQVSEFAKYLPRININILILIGLVVSSAYLLNAFAQPLLAAKKAIFLSEKPQDAIAEFPEPIKPAEIKPYDFYTQGIKSKQIFGPSAQLALESNVTVGANLIKDINLLGVISGDSPQAIIEDKQALKTYYVTKGQLIGEFQVENIGDGKIILNYRGQKFELSI